MVAFTQMPGFGKLDWSNWLYGLFAGFIGGGATAVVSGFVNSAMDPKDYAVGSQKFFLNIGMVFLVSGIINAAMFLKQQPLPSVTTTTTVETTKVQQFPPAIVKTTVEEKRVDPTSGV